MGGVDGLTATRTKGTDRERWSQGHGEEGGPAGALQLQPNRQDAPGPANVSFTLRPAVWQSRGAPPASRNSSFSRHRVPRRGDRVPSHRSALDFHLNGRTCSSPDATAGAP